jgi:hypothetical protein
MRLLLWPVFELSLGLDGMKILERIRSREDNLDFCIPMKHCCSIHRGIFARDVRK